jgi:predicted protein tyrosine phosphatase
MPLRITDKFTAPDHFGWADCIISIDDPGSDITVIGAKHGLFIFEDILNEGPGGPSLAACKAILEHTAACGLGPRSRLLVHCHAGISRSTAVALGVEASLGRTPEEAWRKVYRARPAAWPNHLVDGYFDDLLDLKGGLLAVSAAVERKQRRRFWSKSG